MSFLNLAKYIGLSDKQQHVLLSSEECLVISNYSVVSTSTEKFPEMFVEGPLHHRGITPLRTGPVHMHVQASSKS